jgi:hypothetical protein
MAEELSQPTKHATKIFLTMKAILDTQGNIILKDKL